ncbi:hypothetical protein OG453_06940 [Streptomyces sp. NBC_01381]|uniref:hypothetical protein n=1 Tax=Streptomyces sp. NBC_01381 TaxID=2903845 RepID=UPI002258A1E9|nr:hypothetical protein [Streptomyces sp. NBC_01381]MCX4666403.1 hypothetical protein [Streptomyces sp. NBC_01381]
MTTPDARAAGLFLGAFNIAFEDDERMTISVHTTGGTVSVEGHLSDDYLMTFPVEDVSFLLDRLADLLSKDKPQGSLTVTVPHLGSHSAPVDAWAWNLTSDSGTEPLTPELAATLLPSSANFPHENADLGNGSFPNPPAASMDSTTLTELRRRGLTIEDLTSGSLDATAPKKAVEEAPQSRAAHLQITVTSHNCTGPNARCKRETAAGRPVHVIPRLDSGNLVMPSYHFTSEEEGRQAITQAYESAPTITTDAELYEAREQGIPHKLPAEWIDPSRR